MNDVNKEPGDKEDFLWFDDKEVYHFFAMDIEMKYLGFQHLPAE